MGMMGGNGGNINVGPTNASTGAIGVNNDLGGITFDLGEGLINDFVLTVNSGEGIDSANDFQEEKEYSKRYDNSSTFHNEYTTSQDFTSSARNKNDDSMSASVGVSVLGGDASGGTVTRSGDTEAQPMQTSILGKGGTKDYNKLLVYGGLGLGGILVLKMMMKKG